MLTNDDGGDAPGITAVHDALVAAGHSVTMLLAPEVNQSGSGARTTYSGALAVGQPELGKYWVKGSPADAAEFGLSTVFADEAPDLVISGTNAGQNIGAAAITSGTIEAAATAINEGVPAIAVSTENARNGVSPYTETADFVVDLVSSLDEHSKKGPILPTGIGLNVNYPVVDGGTDTTAIEDDKVAVSVITGNYDASQGSIGSVRSAIETLG
ncbi:hypothetical protein F7P69_19565 [Cellulosimicrobium funkei]|nr:hypothetical protein [Cellulosimicrobium funkei]